MRAEFAVIHNGGVIHGEVASFEAAVKLAECIVLNDPNRISYVEIVQVVGTVGTSTHLEDYRATTPE